MNDLWRALRYLRKYWGTTLGAFLSLLIVTATNLFSPQLLRLVIDQGISAQNLSVILLTSLGLLGVAMCVIASPLHRVIGANGPARERPTICATPFSLDLNISVSAITIKPRRAS